MGHLRRVFTKVVAVIYTGGTVAQILRLIVGFTWQDTPFFIDWILVFLGPIGLAGLIIFSGQIKYRGLWEHITHWLIVAHLAISVLVHVWILVVHSHELVAVLPYEYSYFATAYFAFFAWRSWSIRLVPAPTGPR